MGAENVIQAVSAAWKRVAERSEMIFLVCLRLLYLFATGLFGWVRLSTHEESWKSAEILLLRHQLTVLQRHAVPARPKMTWADRALLAALLGVIPRSRRAGLRMIVTPETVLRWHRDIVRRRWAAKSMRATNARASYSSTAATARLRSLFSSKAIPTNLWSSRSCSSSHQGKLAMDEESEVGCAMRNESGRGTPGRV